MTRPAIPRPLERDVLMEAGHRCAIPTCHQWPVEIAHIIPWDQVKEHSFDNLIALCPTCHSRFDKGEIDRRAMQNNTRKTSQS
jgi:predicted restriction endonuclease